MFTFKFHLSHPSDHEHHDGDGEGDVYSTGMMSAEQLAEHKIALLPWIVSPFKDKPDDDMTLELRHESDPLELFFDLFFIANLATFTSEHSIVDTSTLVAYIGLFAILWFTWFQITLHDVRFGIDSVYERCCKVIQFVIFVGFAFVGDEFNPGSKEHNNTNFRVLCILLFASRLLFAVQYGVALSFIKSKTKSLTLPISMMITALVLIAGSFYSMTPAFSPESGNGLQIYYVWYIILAIEFVLMIGLSSIWRQLSFKKTHLMERMGLLTLMVIGEGAIGVTKTISKLMGDTDGMSFEGYALVVCIVLILVFLWMLYFDNKPAHHYGTIRQQVWSGLHFPLHLGIVGVVEGSQQIALSRQIFKRFGIVEAAVYKACVEQHLDGTALTDAIVAVVTKLKLTDKLESQEQTTIVLQEIQALANTTGICSVENTVDLQGSYGFPAAFTNIMLDILGAIFQSTGIEIPKGADPTDLARSTFTTVYIYYWASLWLTLACFAILYWITRHRDHRVEFFDRVATYTRVAGSLIAAAFTPVAANEVAVYYFLRSPAILPTVAGLLFLVVCCDRFGRQVIVNRLKREGKNAGE
ncbi:Low temperature requirement A, partial [Diplocarpon rosae]